MKYRYVIRVVGEPVFATCKDTAIEARDAAHARQLALDTFFASADVFEAEIAGMNEDDKKPAMKLLARMRSAIDAGHAYGAMAHVSKV